MKAKKTSVKKIKKTPDYKRIYIVSNGFSNLFQEVAEFESMSDPENLVLGDGKNPLYEVLKDPRYIAMKGKLSPNTNITILAHGNTVDGNHVISEDNEHNIVIKSEEFMSNMIADLDAENTALNISLISCYGGAAVLPRNAAKGSILIKHSDPEDVLQAHSGQLNLSADIKDIFNNIMDYSTQTFTIKVKDKAELVMSPPKQMLFTVQEIVKYYEGERNRLVNEYNKGQNKDEKIDPSKLDPFIKDSEKKEGYKVPTIKAIKLAQAWRERNLRYYLMSNKLSSINNIYYGLESRTLNFTKYQNLIDKLKTLGSKEGALVKKIVNNNVDGFNLISYALLNSNPGSLVDSLVELGADLNARNKLGGTTAAHICLASQDVEIIKNLKAKGLNFDIKDDQGQSPIFYCKEVSTLEYFLKDGVDINNKDNKGRSVVRNIIESEDKNLSETKRTELVRYLIKNGAMIDKELSNNAIVMMATTRGETEFHEFVKRCTAKQLSAVHQARFHLGIDFNEKDNLGHTPIFYCRKVSTLEFFLNDGADVNSKNDEGVSIVRNIVESKDKNISNSKKVELLKYLIGKGATIDKEIVDNEIIKRATSKSKSFFRLPKLGKSYVKKVVKSQVGNRDVNPIPRLQIPASSVKDSLKKFFGR